MNGRAGSCLLYTSHDRNPDFNEFLFEDILGKAIRSIASGIEEMDDALEKAQEECDRAFNETSGNSPISIGGGMNRQKQV